MYTINNQDQAGGRITLLHVGLMIYNVINSMCTSIYQRMPHPQMLPMT